MKRPLAAICTVLILLGGAWAAAGEENDPKTSMQAIQFRDWDILLQAQRGHVTVVDLWASWCAPCIERFPHMVDLYQKYRSRGVHFISLNFDEQGDAESLAWADSFLEHVGAVFPNYHLDENMSEAFERLDLLGLPVVLVYDQNGTENLRLTNDDPNDQFDEEDVERAVQTLLEP